MKMLGQGATEYLVLLAVVLIVALVSVALLGFFPGMASDAQLTQSQMYWSSASPIAIVESAARARSDGMVFPHFLLRNTGIYPITITGLVGGDGVKITQFYSYLNAACNIAESRYYNLSEYYYLAPGEEKYISGGSGWYGMPCDRHIYASRSAGGGIQMGGASSVCQNSTASPGLLEYKSLGFEYVEYLDNNQQITKRQMGAKPLVIKCREPV